MSIKTGLKVLRDFEDRAELKHFYEIYGVDGDKYYDLFKSSDLFTFLEEIGKEAEMRFLDFLENEENVKYSIVSLPLNEVIGASMEPLDKLIEKRVEHYVFEKMEKNKDKRIIVSYETRVQIHMKKML